MLDEANDPRSRAAREKESLAHLDSILAALTRLENTPQPPRPGIAAIIERVGDQIRATHAHGASAARIAAALKSSGVAFSEGALRNSIRQFLRHASPPAGSPARRTGRARPAASVPPAQAKPQRSAPPRRGETPAPQRSAPPSASAPNPLISRLDEEL